MIFQYSRHDKQSIPSERTESSILDQRPEEGDGMAVASGRDISFELIWLKVSRVD